MPIYEYLCKECDARYEKIVRSHNEKITCPKCGSGKHALQLSTFAAPRNGSAAAGRAAQSAPACMGNPSACGCSHKN